MVSAIHKLSNKMKIGAIAGVALLLIIFLFMNSGDEIKKTDDTVKEKEKIATGPDQPQINITINTPGIANAELVLSSGEHKPLPYVVSGKEGDKFDFTIRADGYKDKDVDVILTPRRMSYEFNLEKNNY